MLKLIPIIRVNYTFADLIKSLFVSSRYNTYRDQLKNELCSLFFVDNVILTASCRQAIYLLLASIKKNKVVVPSYTCDVVVQAAQLAEKKVIYAHVSKETLNISSLPEIDSDTIVIATHQFGYSCDIETICCLCHERGAVVIEDCAGAFGSKYKGNYVGTFGDFGVFSFNASKSITSPGGGGFIISNKKIIDLLDTPHQIKTGIVDKCKAWLKSFGLVLNNNSYFHYLLQLIGKKPHLPIISEQCNEPMDASFFVAYNEWQAYVTIKQIKKYQNIAANKTFLFQLYRTRLKTPLISILDSAECNLNRYATYVKNRESFVKFCNEKGVGIGHGFESVVCPKEFVDERLFMDEIVYLPFGSNYTEKEVELIIKTINEAYDHTAK